MPWDEGFMPSYSFLKSMAYENDGSPKKAIWKRQQPRTTTAAQHFGNVVEDFLFLTGEEINKKYFTVDLMDRPLPEKTMRTAANKDWLNNLMLSNQDKICLDKELKESALEIAANVASQSPLMINGQAQAKVIGELEGVQYIGYIDNLSQGNFAVDIKTCGSASAKFDLEIRKNFYDVQAVLYMNAAKVNVFYWLAIETKEPHDFDTHFMTWGDDRFEKALTLAKKWCRDYKRCQEENAWKKGYSFHSGVQSREIQVRRWTEDLEIA